MWLEKDPIQATHFSEKFIDIQVTHCFHEPALEFAGPNFEKYCVAIIFIDYITC